MKPSKRTKRVIIQWLRSNNPKQQIKAIKKLENCGEDAGFAFGTLVNMVRKADEIAYWAWTLPSLAGVAAAKDYVNKYCPSYLALTQDL